MKIEETYLLKGRRILVAACGSIAAVKTPLLISSLIKSGAEVRCVVTPSAAQLVSPLALATLSRNRCYQDKDQWDPNEPKPLHIELAEWAEIVVIAPLSASTLSRWTKGLAEGLLASVLLAAEVPVIAAAAMNTGMWRNSFIQNNWKLLQRNPNILPLVPSAGLLACDRIGEGRMVEIDLIQLAITSGIIQKEKHGKLIKDWDGLTLIATAGPTEEALDPARVFTNRSSGMMGVVLAQAAKLRGAKVELVHGPLNLPSALLEGLSSHAVTNAEQMRKILERLQSSANAIAMAAAVADIRKVGGSAEKKLSKVNFLQSLGNTFEPVPDLLAELVQKKPIGQVLLGFSALTGNDNELLLQGKAKKVTKGCDLLMANPIDRPGQGFGEQPNGGFLLGPDETVRPLRTTSKLDLAHQLLDAMLLEMPSIIP